MPEHDTSQVPSKPKAEQDQLTEEPKIYPVYVYERTCQDIFNFCLREAQRRPPREALGVILGFRRQWQGTKYVRVTDWATGQVESSMTYARFTPEGILEYRLALHDRYGSNPHTPRVIGLWHSHPFGGNPQFSSTDINTFFRTPFCAEGNVFFLIDPLSRFFKVYMLRRSSEKDVLRLERVEWCTYQPKVPTDTPPSEDAWDSEEGGSDRA